MNYIELGISLAVIVSLAVALFVFVKKCLKDKGWAKLLDFALSVIEEAESKYESGADKLEYATAMILKVAEEIGFKISESDVKIMIENIIKVTKSVNSK